jgi:hypothetical protein
MGMLNFLSMRMLVYWLQFAAFIPLSSIALVMIDWCSSSIGQIQHIKSGTDVMSQNHNCTSFLTKHQKIIKWCVCLVPMTTVERRHGLVCSYYKMSSDKILFFLTTLIFFLSINLFQLENWYLIVKMFYTVLLIGILPEFGQEFQGCRKGQVRDKLWHLSQGDLHARMSFLPGPSGPRIRISTCLARRLDPFMQTMLFIKIKNPCKNWHFI